MSNKVEASQAFLDSIKSQSARLQHASLEGLMAHDNAANLSKEDADLNDKITLGRVMELDEMSGGTPMRELMDNPYKAHLFATDAANFVKRRLVDDYTPLQTTFSVDGGILASTVGSIHRPAIVDLCGGTEVRIQPLPDNKKGSVGQWKPIDTPDEGAFRTAPFEEIFTVVPEYANTPMGSVFKYAFAMNLTSKNTLSGISVDVAARWMDGVMLFLECEMLNRFYNRLLLKGEHIGTDDLGSQTREGTQYNIDEYVWRKLHKAFGKNHGMTDVFCHEDQEQIIHRLPIRSSASIVVSPSESLTELRNRLADGTYVWSHFLDEPDEHLIPAIDRKSCAALYYVENSEISERKIEILTGSTIITFSIVLGFDVIDEAGLKIVEVVGA